MPKPLLSKEEKLKRKRNRSKLAMAKKRNEAIEEEKATILRGQRAKYVEIPEENTLPDWKHDV